MKLILGVKIHCWVVLYFSSIVVIYPWMSNGKVQAELFNSPYTEAT